MDEIKAAPDGSNTELKTHTDDPFVLTVGKKKTPEDASTTEPKSDKQESANDLQALPQFSEPRAGIFRKIWLWVKRDTTATEWLIVILTAVIAGTSYLQWREIHASSIDTHTLAQAADAQAKKMTDVSAAADKIRQAAQDMVIQDQRIADNSKESLDASNKQSKAALDASIAASRNDQRAWVAEVNLGFDAPEVGKFLVVSVTWNNSGKTFAKRVTALCHFVFVPAPIPDEKTLVTMAGVSPAPVGSIGVLAPSAQYKSPLKSPVPLTETDKERISTWYTYIWGEMTYDDIFGHTHNTIFCSKRQGTSDEFTQCPYHNDAN